MTDSTTPVTVDDIRPVPSRPGRLFSASDFVQVTPEERVRVVDCLRTQGTLVIAAAHSAVDEYNPALRISADVKGTADFFWSLGVADYIERYKLPVYRPFLNYLRLAQFELPAPPEEQIGPAVHDWSSRRQHRNAEIRAERPAGPDHGLI